MPLGAFGNANFGDGKFGGIVDVTVNPAGIRTTIRQGSPVVDVYCRPAGVRTTTHTAVPTIWLGPNVLSTGVRATVRLGKPFLQLLPMPVPGGTGLGPGLNPMRVPRGRSLASHARKTDGGEEADVEAILLLMVA